MILMRQILTCSVPNSGRNSSSEHAALSSSGTASLENLNTRSVVCAPSTSADAENYRKQERTELVS